MPLIGWVVLTLIGSEYKHETFQPITTQYISQPLTFILFVCLLPKGHLTVNGVKQEKLPSRVGNLGNVARLSWFARLGDLTVREHLTLSALMTTAGNMCNIVERVEQIIREVSDRGLSPWN